LSRAAFVAIVLLPLAPSIRGQEAPSVDCSLIVLDAERRHALEAYSVGRDLVMAERWVEAEDPLTATVRLDPLRPEGHYALGQALMGLKRYPEAVGAFSRSREAFSCAALSDAARREAERRIDEEMRSIRDSLRGMEQERLRLTRVTWREMNSETPLTLPESNRLLQQLEARLAELQRWKKRIGSPPAEVFLALGSAHFNTGSLPNAEREYRAALGLDPGSGDAHNNLAVVLMLTERLEEAEREVKLAEKAGVPVNPRLKDEIRTRKAAAAAPAGNPR
jgi:tetratricopeptide (TPR) repeat protein